MQPIEKTKNVYKEIRNDGGRDWIIGCNSELKSVEKNNFALSAKCQINSLFGKRYSQLSQDFKISKDMRHEGVKKIFFFAILIFISFQYAISATCAKIILHPVGFLHIFLFRGWDSFLRHFWHKILLRIGISMKSGMRGK